MKQLVIIVNISYCFVLTCNRCNQCHTLLIEHHNPLFPYITQPSVDELPDEGVESEIRRLQREIHDRWVMLYFPVFSTVRFSETHTFFVKNCTYFPLGIR